MTRRERLKLVFEGRKAQLDALNKQAAGFPYPIWYVHAYAPSASP